jgi:hypothetical protein
MNTSVLIFNLGRLKSVVLPALRTALNGIVSQEQTTLLNDLYSATEWHGMILVKGSTMVDQDDTSGGAEEGRFLALPMSPGKIANSIHQYRSCHAPCALKLFECFMFSKIESFGLWARLRRWNCGKSLHNWSLRPARLHQADHLYVDSRC